MHALVKPKVFEDVAELNVSTDVLLDNLGAKVEAQFDTLVNLDLKCIILGFGHLLEKSNLVELGTSGQQHLETGFEKKGSVCNESLMQLLALFIFLFQISFDALYLVLV